MEDKVVTVGSRGSLLALRQTELVVDKLRRTHPDCLFVIQKIKTKGDQDPDVPLTKFAGKGVFIAELEAALLDGKIDLAVHSFKDLPTQLSPGLRIAAVIERDDPRDVLISASSCPLSQLPQRARLGTGSPRRAVQLKALRPDLEFCHIRGNIDTRCRKLVAQGFDGIILAAAGLIRLGWQDRITEYLSPEICLPAVGQGALAVEVREGDTRIGQLVAAIDHPFTRRAVVAERSFLQGVGGGCHAPIAALGRVVGNILELEGLVASVGGEVVLRGREEGLADNPEEVGKKLAVKLLGMGAREILAKAEPQ